jgi:hypothetical protein
MTVTEPDSDEEEEEEEQERLRKEAEELERIAKGSRESAQRQEATRRERAEEEERIAKKKEEKKELRPETTPAAERERREREAREQADKRNVELLREIEARQRKEQEERTARIAKEQREKEEREAAIEAVRRAEEAERRAKDEEAARVALLRIQRRKEQEERDRRLAEDEAAERLRRQAEVAAAAPKKAGPDATFYRVRVPVPRLPGETDEQYITRLMRQRAEEAAAARRTQGFRSTAEPYQVRCPHIAVLGAAPAVKLASGLVAYCADCVDAQVWTAFLGKLSLSPACFLALPRTADLPPGLSAHGRVPTRRAALPSGMDILIFVKKRAALTSRPCAWSVPWRMSTSGPLDIPLLVHDFAIYVSA